MKTREWNEIIQAIATRQRHLHDMKIDDLRSMASCGTDGSKAAAREQFHGMTKQQVVEEIIFDEFSLEYRHRIDIRVEVQFLTAGASKSDHSRRPLMEHKPMTDIQCRISGYVTNDGDVTDDADHEFANMLESGEAYISDFEAVGGRLFAEGVKYATGWILFLRRNPDFSAKGLMNDD